MSSVQSGIGSELRYIYAILRRLKAIRKAEFNQGSKINPTGLEASLFSREFLLNILEERLSALDGFAEELISGLFKKLNKKVTKLNEGSEITPIRSNTLKSKCHELDEFFHYSLYYLHDFIIELDWHESDAEWQEGSSELIYVNNFIDFRKALNNFVQKLKTVNDKNLTTKSTLNVSTETSSEIKPLKSNLSSIRSASPGRKRRVRFRDESPDESNESEYRETMSNDKERRDIQSLLALDLIIYAMNLFIQQLSGHLDEFVSKSTDLRDLLKPIKESKKKIHTAQLNSISRKIKNSNDVYLTVLDFLFDLRKTYMIDYLFGIVCANDSLSIHKSPRIGIFIQKVEFDVERKLIERLAHRCLQILVDLIISEISLPPVELKAETTTKSREEVVKSRENYLNFISSWMNIDDVVFGSARSKKRTKDSNLKEPEPPKKNSANESTLANGGKFKSSSRILAQMENLNELARDLFDQVLNRMQSVQQIKYFLELIHLGFEDSFDTISNQIYSQLSSLRQKNPEKNLSNSNLKDLSAVSNSIDLITAKVRCLKLIHIMSSIDKLIKEVAIKRKVELSERSLDSKLNKFIDECGQQTLTSK